MIDDVNDALSPVIDAFNSVVAQYKYIAAVNMGEQHVDPLPGVPHKTLDKSYDDQGIGRIGFLSVDPAGTESPIVKVALKPERFRAKVAQLAGEYLQHHTADWEIRP